MKKAVVVLGLGAVLAACTPDHPATTALDADAKRFEPNPGAGAIYIVRARDAVFLAGVPVQLDGQPVASLRRDDYARVDVPPGQHRISCGDTNTTQVVQVAPSQVAFVEAKLQVGLLAPSCALQPMDDVSGRERVMSGKRAGPQM
ncbi:hypothetical protein [Vineibacter terrae]|uniref:hypothetical protein n=1 Tax=Vineibacter terrae TaxID=2586908 RepID=UPI002E34DC6B|nr:hypothetical protein [Vineibacter terrae]HEX2891399.1 hypothetical protein [Vineibacter terrae]